MKVKRLHESSVITDDTLAQWYCEYYGIELWKDIPELEGYYQASTLGRIRSVNHNRLVNVFNKAVITREVKGRVLSIKSKNNKGYYQFSVTVGGKRITMFVHLAIANTWVPNPNNLPCVNHKDEDKTNNCVWNLEWCTYQYNNTYGTSVKRSSLKKSKPVLQYTKDGVFVKEWVSVSEASKVLNISLQSISKVCKKVKYCNTAGGFKWNYKSN